MGALTAQRSYSPAQLNGPILPHSSMVLVSRTAQQRGGDKILYLEEQKGGPQTETQTDRNTELQFTEAYQRINPISNGEGSKVPELFFI